MSGVSAGATETRPARDRRAELPGRITFYEFFEPPLDSGSYRADVKHHVWSTAKSNPFDQTFEARLDFHVSGVRFALPPGYVHTQFPPPGAQGRYENVLPHVVLAVETLPWQRDSGSAALGLEETHPWLALLTFDGGDPPPAVENGTVGQLLPTALPVGTVSYPNLKLEPGESASDPCEFVDVPVELFRAIAPSVDDLRWLAHGRHVDEVALARKSFTAAETPPPQDLSTVISNRLPAPGGRAVCCLVSVEGMAPLLPPRDPPPGTTAIRLVVLAWWSFGSVERKEAFREYFERLDRKPGTLQVPYGAGPGQPSQAVQDALQMGYAAFDHRTRQGARTVSWYRGPLLPYENPRLGDAPFNSADSLVRYDPESGMIDVSFAAAWQLGRLLALGDQAFASLLYDWKEGRLTQAVVDFERRFLGEKLGVAASALEVDPRAHVALMQSVIKPLLDALVGEGG